MMSETGDEPGPRHALEHEACAATYALFAADQMQNKGITHEMDATGFSGALAHALCQLLLSRIKRDRSATAA